MSLATDIHIPFDSSLPESMRELQERLSSAFKPIYESTEKLRRAFGFRCRSYFGEAGQEVAMRLGVPCEDGASWSAAVEIGAKALLRTPDEIRQFTDCELEELARAWLAQDDYRCRDTFELIAVASDRLLGEQDDMRPVVRQRPLSHTAERVAQFVRENPGKIGTEIAFALRISPEGVRQVFFHYLFDRRFKNRRDGKGYFPPEE